MNYIDYIIIGVILIGFILGFKDGLIRKLIGFIGFFLGIFLAYEFAAPFANIISPLLNDEIYLAKIVAGFVIFAIVIFVFAILKRVIHPFDKVNRFVNQFLGGLAGVIQIIFFISAFLLLLNIFDIPNKVSREKSVLYFKAYNVIPISVNLIMGSNSKAQNYIINFIESKEDSL